MYRKESDEWLKHYDFLLLDMICLQIAFMLPFALLGNGINPYAIPLYRNMAIFLELIDMLVIFLFDTLSGVLKKGYYRDFVTTVQHGAIVGASSVVYLFLIQEGEHYPRLYLAVTIALYMLITYIVRELRKRNLRKQMIADEDGRRPLFIITSRDRAEEVIDHMRHNNYARYRLAGASIIDADLAGTQIHELDIVTNREDIVSYVCHTWIDEILIALSDEMPYPKELIDQLAETGVTIHMDLTYASKIPGRKQLVEKVGNYTVLTTSINYASARALLVKRLMDIVGGLVGCLFTCILFLFVAPAIYIRSPGPIFFTQERVGKNGKVFKMYKFRSMYVDADAHREELMKDNRLSDGKMFKMDFDPRVIGNKILPDGTKKTGIGNFIRRTSIDEFPQFINVLKGDMSIVGTRPPLVSETNLYERHHYARLAIKPGVTGLWQISGRSEITDFEEVVRLDMEYINNWDIGQDIKIILKTIPVILGKKGSL